MDSLFAKADAIAPVSKRRKTGKHAQHNKPGPSKQTNTDDDKTVHSVVPHTNLPPSLRPTSPPPEGTKKYSHIANKKLRTHLTRQSTHTARAKALVKDAELLLTEDAGMVEVEGELEKTWRVSQKEVSQAAGQVAAQARQEWKLDGGPYRSRYTRNGRCVGVYLAKVRPSRTFVRHLAVVGRKGHVATFDWQTGTLHSELQLGETCRDITYVISLSLLMILLRTISQVPS